ncbi:MAG: hypothetical protein FJ122_07175 [Deltaproteobacteria bacterium]|nr:hypothetical protein [Deltaproteobacteria bacterium]
MKLPGRIIRMSIWSGASEIIAKANGAMDCARPEQCQELIRMRKSLDDTGNQTCRAGKNCWRD